MVKQGMTTKAAETLLSSVVRHTSQVGFDVSIAQHFMQAQIACAPLVALGEIVPPTSLPSLATVYLLDAVVAKVCIWFTYRQF